MSRRFFLLSCAITFMLTLLSTSFRPVAASSLISTFTVNCDSVTFTGNLGYAFLHYGINATVITHISPPITSIGSTLTNADGSWSFTVPLVPAGYPAVTIAPGTPLTVEAPGVGSFPATVPSCGVAVQFFDPHDGRLDPRPGDRIAVYCNTTANSPTLGVIIIDATGQGFEQFTIDYNSLKKAGVIVSTDNGSANTIVTWTDTNNAFAVSWRGQFGANGQGIFAKSFVCDYK